MLREFSASLFLERSEGWKARRPGRLASWKAWNNGRKGPNGQWITKQIGIIPIFSYSESSVPVRVPLVSVTTAHHRLNNKNISLSGTRPCVHANFKINSRHISRWVVHALVCMLKQHEHKGVSHFFSKMLGHQNRWKTKSSTKKSNLKVVKKPIKHNAKNHF